MNDDVVDLNSERQRRFVNWKLRDYERYDDLLIDLLNVQNKYGCRDDTLISALANALVITGARANVSGLLLLKILSIEIGDHARDTEDENFAKWFVDGVPPEWMEGE
jgi:hypothetical protein